MTRIGVNLLWLVPGVVGGSEESTMRALDAVCDPAADAALDVVLLALPQLQDAHPEVTRRFHTVVGPVDGHNKARRVLSENTWLHAAARDHRIDLLHHAGGVVPPGAPRPSTLTIHDLQPLDHPDHFTMTKRTYLRTVMSLSTRRARRIGVPSDFTKSRVEERLDVDPSRIDVVPWSVTLPDLDASADDARLIADRDAIHLQGLGDRFLLYPAVTYRHKNHLMLLDAFDELARRDDTIELVLTGGTGENEEAVRARILRSPAAMRIHRLGRVPVDALEALYRRSVAVVYPSTYEGFGLPPLEAMARCCPVVVSDIPALVEVVAGDALVVDPDDVEGWAAAMATLCGDEARRRELAVAGRARAASFGPDRTAAALLGLWLDALGATEVAHAPPVPEPPENAA